MGRLWDGAVTILNGDDRDWKQMLPRDLDDDEFYGRQHIETLLSMRAHAHGHSTFLTLARPFLLVITHQALLGCLSVDTAVGGLYNFISGTNGSRAVSFFQRLSSSLEENVNSATPSPKAILETTLIATLRALQELLRREQRAAFHDDLPGLINSIDNLVGVAGIDARSVAFQVLRNNIAELRGMIGRATNLLQPDGEPQVDGVSTTVVTSTYPRDLVIPQDRHDNDKADIAKIKILPTEDEIRSDHAEFLPSTDRDQPHFLADQVERHLDTHFRLLRHDVLGEMSEAIGGMMVALEADTENPKLNLGNTRAYVNLQARVSYVSFERRRGLEVQIAFLQPGSLRRKSSSERRRWWEESKRLEEGILLVFLFVDDDTKSSLLFFTVSRKCTDAKEDYGLSSNAHQATITAKLATRNQGDLEKLIRLSTSNRHTRGVLVEFPGAIPATFVPILESIQNMQRLNQLPFRQWILPDRIATYDESMAFDVPPPLYTRSPGFNFSLQPILKDAGDELYIDPKTPPDDIATIDELERRTNLDRGQCQALAAALTREFVFIQGPPGTGKSYLGVQLMRVLLACKMKADLGPVLVV